MSTSPPSAAPAPARPQTEAERLFDVPIEGALARAKAWASLLLVDHGIVRPVYWNFGEVTPELWRGPQPNPLHIAGLAQRGLKTIVNLRGANKYGSYALAREAAARHGIALENAVIWSRSAPQVEQIHRLREVFDTIAYPALLHCKSGADRAGIASALYLILKEGRPVEEARHQLSLRWGHVATARTGVLDAFFERYLSDTAERPMHFMTWVDTVYDRAAVERDFHARPLASLWVDKILRRE